MPFSRMCGTITLTKHTYNANYVYVMLHPEQRTKIIYTMKIDVFFK